MAVKHHRGDVELILKSVNAILKHYGANVYTSHETNSMCPLGLDYCCKYQSAIANGITPPRHPNFLAPDA